MTADSRKREKVSLDEVPHSNPSDRLKSPMFSLEVTSNCANCQSNQQRSFSADIQYSYTDMTMHDKK